MVSDNPQTEFPFIRLESSRVSSLKDRKDRAFSNLTTSWPGEHLEFGARLTRSYSDSNVNPGGRSRILSDSSGGATWAESALSRLRDGAARAQQLWERQFSSSPHSQRKGEWVPVQRAYSVPTEQKDKLRKFTQRAAILPSSHFLAFWDILMFVLLIATGIVEPYVLVFDVEGFKSLFYYWASAGLFMSDTVLRFFRAQKKSTRDGVVLVTNIPEIARMYMKDWMFCFDVLSGMPFGAIFTATGLANADEGRLLGIVRMVRFLKFARLPELLHRIHDVTGWSFSALSIFQFGMISCLVLHWIACLWAFLGNRAASWLSTVKEHYDFLEFEDNLDMYLMSLYWSVTVLSSVGFGDITPQARSEFFWAIVCMAVGGTVWAYVVGSVCGMAAVLDKHRTAFENQINDVNVMCAERGLPPNLVERIRDFYKHAKEFMRMQLYHETIRQLSPALKGEVVSWMYGSCFKRVWYFDVVDEKCAKLLTEGMVPKLYAQEEWIEDTIEGVRCLVFLRSGLCVRKCNLLAPGAVWGLDVILGSEEHHDIEELLDEALARSINFAFVLKLSKCSIDHAASLVPEFAKRLRKAHLRMLFWRGVIAASRATKRLKKPKVEITTSCTPTWDRMGKLMAEIVHMDCCALHEAECGSPVVPDSIALRRSSSARLCRRASHAALDAAKSSSERRFSLPCAATSPASVPSVAKSAAAAKSSSERRFSLPCAATSPASVPSVAKSAAAAESSSERRFSLPCAATSPASVPSVAKPAASPANFPSVAKSAATYISAPAACPLECPPNVSTSNNCKETFSHSSRDAERQCGNGAATQPCMPSQQPEAEDQFSFGKVRINIKDENAEEIESRQQIGDSTITRHGSQPILGDTAMPMEPSILNCTETDDATQSWLRCTTAFSDCILGSDGTKTEQRANIALRRVLTAMHVENGIATCPAMTRLCSQPRFQSPHGSRNPSKQSDTSVLCDTGRGGNPIPASQQSACPASAPSTTVPLASSSPSQNMLLEITVSEGKYDPLHETSKQGIVLATKASEEPDILQRSASHETPPTDLTKSVSAPSSPGSDRASPRPRGLRKRSASSLSPKSDAGDETNEEAWRKDIDRKLDDLNDGLLDMNEGMADDVAALRGDVADLTKLMHQLLSRFDAEEKY